MANDEQRPFRMLDLMAALRYAGPLHRDEAGGAWVVTAWRTHVWSSRTTRAPRTRTRPKQRPYLPPGAPLARMEARYLLQRLFTRFPKLRLADPDAPTHWRRIPGFRGIERLDVRID